MSSLFRKARKGSSPSSTRLRRNWPTPSATALADQLSQHDGLFRSVEEIGGGKFFESNGLFFSGHAAARRHSEPAWGGKFPASQSWRRTQACEVWSGRSRLASARRKKDGHVREHAANAGTSSPTPSKACWRDAPPTSREGISAKRAGKAKWQTLADRDLAEARLQFTGSPAGRRLRPSAKPAQRSEARIRFSSSAQTDRSRSNRRPGIF